MNKLLSGIVIAVLAAGTSFAGPAKAKQAKSAVLKEGHYTAKVKAIVCGGCGEYIQKAMSEVKGIESASVDQENATVHFMVQKGASVKTADLQKSLDAWAAKMGMGADYNLSELKAVKKMS